ncbi:MAG: UV DNA damage repair endonuclease UvsE [Erysipelotrichaceae bacterium]|nr:UV DNA damage repair endonuclease UvsE [Erysipelotrichaceae bacterium]
MDNRRIGYACQNLDIPSNAYKTIRVANFNDVKVREIIKHNLRALEETIDYNIENGIRLFRVTSSLIPFASNQKIMKLDWQNEFKNEFRRIKEKVLNNDIRISMHPGQYVVLNSPNENTVSRSIEELNYHLQVIQSLGGNKTSKMIIHIGGVFKDKTESIHRFIDIVNNRLTADIKEHLVIENDDKLYNIEDVLYISSMTRLPVVFDNLHNEINQGPSKYDNRTILNKVQSTWKKEDGRLKIHYSQQAENKRIGAHTYTIEASKFLEFFNPLKDLEFDIMLEVKDKNRSAVKINLLLNNIIKDAEKEWSRYKYLVLGKSSNSYLQIRDILKDKKNFSAINFYNIIDGALKEKENKDSEINALQHVWGYLKNESTKKEKATFLTEVEKYKNSAITLQKVKKSLFKMVSKYNIGYLLKSYYFTFEDD